MEWLSSKGFDWMEPRCEGWEWLASGAAGSRLMVPFDEPEKILMLES